MNSKIIDNLKQYKNYIRTNKTSSNLDKITPTLSIYQVVINIEMQTDQAQTFNPF